MANARTPAPYSFAPQMSRDKRAFGLVEVLLALALSTMVLIAVAASVNSAFSGFRILQQRGAMSMTGRMAMQRMTTLLRSCKGVAQPYSSNPSDPLLTNFKAGNTVTCSAFELLDSEYTAHRFTYDSTQGILYYATADPDHLGTATPHAIVHGLSDFPGGSGFQVVLVPAMSQASLRRTGGYHGYDEVGSAQITLNLDPSKAASGNAALIGAERSGATSANSIRLAATVFPRAANYQQSSLSIDDTTKAFNNWR